MAVLFDTGIFSAIGLASELLVGAKLYWYATGTSTPLATYFDDGLTVANANPVVADAAARFPPIYLQNADYKYVLKSAGDVTLATRDPVHGETADQAAAQAMATLAASSGATLIGSGPAGWTVNSDILTLGTPLGRYGGGDGKTAAQNTTAFQDAMEELMDKWPGSTTFYPAGPGEPTATGYQDPERRDRRTGRILVPGGMLRFEPETFSSYANPRSPFVGFTFEGEDPSSTVLMMETGGAEAWMFRTVVGQERYQKMVFRGMTLMSDDWRYGSFARMYSTGVSKQFLVDNCRLRDIQHYMWTEGDGNADLNRTTNTFLEHYNRMLVLDNPQSVQHDFLGTQFRSFGTQVHVKQHGGGNVNIQNASIDLLWYEGKSPDEGTYLFAHDADAMIGQGNCTYAWGIGARMEIEAYMHTGGDPKVGLAKMPAAPTAFPIVTIEGMNGVTGKTFAFNQGTGVVSGESYRPIKAVQIDTGKYIGISKSVLLKTYLYEVSGDVDTGSPAFGGIIDIDRCYDGVLDELPIGHTDDDLLHDRVTYNGSAGRVITSNMRDRTTGSPYTRKMLDCDPRGPLATASEPSWRTGRTTFKPKNYSFPLAANATGDFYIDIPLGLTEIDIRILKPASGASTNPYQLHVKNGDRSGPIIASSGSGLQHKDAQNIDAIGIDVSAVRRLCLCAEGTGTDQAFNGIAWVMA